MDLWEEDLADEGIGRDLQARGLLRLERGVGTFVAERPEEPITPSEFEAIAGRASELVRTSRDAGLSMRELSQLVERLWKETDQ